MLGSWLAERTQSLSHPLQLYIFSSSAIDIYHTTASKHISSISYALEDTTNPTHCACIFPNESLTANRAVSYLDPNPPLAGEPASFLGLTHHQSLLESITPKDIQFPRNPHFCLHPPTPLHISQWRPRSVSGNDGGDITGPKHSSTSGC